MSNMKPPENKKTANFFKTGYKNPLGETIDIHWRVPEWFKDVDKARLDRLLAFHDELLKFNNTVNLIGVKTIASADQIHFADCMIALRHVTPHLTTQEVYDLGSGNGFPGLVLSIMNPELKVNMVDADQRKCEFLKHVIAKLNIQNAKVLNSQIEKLPDSSVQFAVTRGLATVSKAVLLMRKPFKKGGTFFHLKGEEWFNEVSSLPTQLCAFWKPSLVGEYRLPNSEVNYAVVRTDKIAD